ncbi:MAG: BON domain-containing protein [Phycisphaerales bacterium]|jgi:osmotically-inducible protein OsmY
MKLILAASLIGSMAALTACDKTPSSSSTTTSDSSTTTSSEARARERAQETKPVAPDNTGKNTRDRDGMNTTPTDAGQNSSDVKIAADIRSSVMKISGLSTSGQNCKIVVNGGAVTLRGPVATADEKSQIAAAARATAGVTSVDDQLEVSKP